MKKIYQLKTLLDFVLWLSIVVLAVSITAVVVALTGNPTGLNLKVNGQSLEQIDNANVPVIASLMIGYLFFILALFQLKKLLSLFVEKHFFTSESVRSLRKIGLFLFAACLLLYIPSYLYDIFASNTLDISFSSVNPESFFFLLIIALFFFTLSHIFNEAKALREEHELTV
jgi:magnesium-transporting ATPase (P-type)